MRCLTSPTRLSSRSSAVKRSWPSHTTCDKPVRPLPLSFSSLTKCTVLEARPYLLPGENYMLLYLSAWLNLYQHYSFGIFTVLLICKNQLCLWWERKHLFCRRYWDLLMGWTSYFTCQCICQLHFFITTDIDLLLVIADRKLVVRCYPIIYCGGSCLIVFMLHPWIAFPEMQWSSIKL